MGSPFDTGLLGDCEVPATNYCTGITYEVPAVFSRLTAFIEFEIKESVEVLEEDHPTCVAAYKDTVCRKKFPRCSIERNQVYFERSENCEQRLRSECADQANALIQSGFCNYTELNLDSGSCRSLSSRNHSNELHQCNLLEGDILVSDWMYEYIKQIDSVLNESFIRFPTNCWQKYRIFLCSVSGHCVGNRIQLINTREMCQAVLNW